MVNKIPILEVNYSSGIADTKNKTFLMINSQKFKFQCFEFFLNCFVLVFKWILKIKCSKWKSNYTEKTKFESQLSIAISSLLFEKKYTSNHRFPQPFAVVFGNRVELRAFPIKHIPNHNFCQVVTLARVGMH